MARHGKAEVSVGAMPAARSGPATRHTLASVGISRQAASGGFLGTQRYEVDAAAPARINLPVRRTAKLLELDYLGPLAGAQAQNAKPWRMSNGKLKLIGTAAQNRRPIGWFVHHLPGLLKDVLVVYCLGGGGDPKVRLADNIWEAGQVLELGDADKWLSLVKNPGNANYTNRDFDAEGFLLGELSAKSDVKLSDVARQFAMLSFFSLLPPPDYHRAFG